MNLIPTNRHSVFPNGGRTPVTTPRRRGYKTLSLAQLRSFCEVCRRAGYAAAARELDLTSPAVWEQVKALERHYGCRLLAKAGSRIEPTPEGAQLLELLGPVLAGLDSTKDVLLQA